MTVRLAVVVCGLFQTSVYPTSSNGVGWLEACIAKWYPHAYQIVLVEGALRDFHAHLSRMGSIIQRRRLQTSFLEDPKLQSTIFDMVKSAPRTCPPSILFTSWIASDRGHSTDNTLQQLNDIPDRQHKIAIVQQDLRPWMNWDEQFHYVKRYVAREVTHILYIHPLDILPEEDIKQLLAFIDHYDQCIHIPAFPFQTYIGDDTTLYQHVMPQTIVGNWAPHLVTHGNYTPSSDITCALRSALHDFKFHRYTYANLNSVKMWCHMGLDKNMQTLIREMVQTRATPPRGLRRHPHTPLFLTE